ncbi:hypothetical protein ABEF93_006854 [Exophiala dermatitidis]
MQDNAPAHAAKRTIEELLERRVQLIWWPANSPDLNPIETVWKWMKDWLQKHYPDPYASYNELRNHDDATPRRKSSMKMTKEQQAAQRSRTESATYEAIDNAAEAETFGWPGIGDFPSRK